MLRYKFFGPHMGVMYAKAEVLDKIRTIRVLADDKHGGAGKI